MLATVARLSYRQEGEVLRLEGSLDRQVARDAGLVLQLEGVHHRHPRLLHGGRG